jgi:hypothetical protein
MKERKNMEKKGIIRAIVFAVMVLFISGTAWAADQAAKGDEPADNMQLVKEKIQADKKLLVAANMNLTENEAKAFWPVYESYQKELSSLNERAIKNIAVYAENSDKMTNDMAKKVVTEHVNVTGERQKLMKSYLPKFAKAIPYKKVMRYYQIENKILAVVMYEAAKKIPLVD